MKILKLLSTVAIALAILPTFAEEKKLVVPDNLVWHDFKSLGLEGQAWPEAKTPYGRVGTKFKDTVPERIWNLSTSSTGMCVNFETDAKEIWIRRSFGNRTMQGVCYTLTGYCGFDLYAKDKNGMFRWLASTNYNNADYDTYPIFKTNGKKYEYRIYLPMRNALLKGEVGVPKGCYFKATPARKKPIVFYGTSIVHGAYVSHPGISHPSIIGRRLDMPIVNLGFSGSAKMELSMADLLADIDAAAYVIDAQPNMHYRLVKERCEPFLRRLRKLKPDTPILLVERAQSLLDWYWYDDENKQTTMWLEQRKIYDKLIAEGEKNMLYLRGDKLFGGTGEESIDNVHPNDLGFMSMADKMTPLLKKLLKK